MGAATRLSRQRFAPLSAQISLARPVLLLLSGAGFLRRGPGRENTGRVFFGDTDMPRKKRDPRGGAREGAGRKPIAPGVIRVPLSIMVRPDTLARIDAFCARNTWSRGAVIDAILHFSTKDDPYFHLPKPEIEMGLKIKKIKPTP